MKNFGSKYDDLMSGKVCKHIHIVLSTHSGLNFAKKSANLVILTKKISIKLVELLLFFKGNCLFHLYPNYYLFIALFSKFQLTKNFPSSHQDQLILQNSLNNWRGVLQLTAQNYFTHSITFEVLLCKNRVCIAIAIYR